MDIWKARIIYSLWRALDWAREPVETVTHFSLPPLVNLNFCCVMQMYPDVWQEYQKIIDQPMDLHTIRLRLSSGSYQNINDFNSDCKLVLAYKCHTIQ